MEIPSANYCTQCGAEAEGDSLLCATCGRPMVGGQESSAPVPYLISPNRILFLSFLSFGLYLLYWLYKTWSHFRDHTGAVAFPIAHGLTAFVPIYGSFRAHAHLRTFGELAGRAGLDLRFNPGLAFLLVLMFWVLSFAAGGVSSVEVVEVIDPVTGQQVIDPNTGVGVTEVINPTRSEQMLSLLLRISAIIAGVWLIFHAQPRINYYWDHIYGSRLRGVAVGKGEIIVGFLGGFFWAATLVSILFAQ